MKGVILAAGRGSRMVRFTEDRPKCLNLLAGRTLLDWQLDSLRKGGVRDIVVVGGYRSDQLVGDWTLIVNPRWAETNMVRSLCAASDLLQAEGAVISYSDIVYSPDHIVRLLACDAEIAITYDERWMDLWSLRFDDPLSDAESFKTRNGRLVEIGAKSKTVQEIEGQYMGLLKISAEGWKTISGVLQGLPEAAVDKLDMTSLLSMLLERDSEIRTVPVVGKWCEVDSAGDLEIYEAAIESNRPWGHDWRI